MPTFLVWEYSGVATWRRGEQRVFSGDSIIDDVFGHGIAIRLIVQLSLQPTITRSTVCDLLLVTCR